MSNQLKTQSSPYLLQHAQNPVDWFPWCEEAFQKAEEEGKPVFLSIGYSTCHWCHVMAHESFEDEKTAAILNQYFVSVKVDREERPDIDSVYMSVCQAFTGSGGWPMSIFMTAQQKPFFAGTYFPPASRYGMVGFQDLLLTVARQWREERPSLLAAADQVLSAMRGQSHLSPARSWQNPTANPNAPFLHPKAVSHLLKQAADNFTQSFDPVHGGFGPAPKFPLPHNLIFLILYARLFHSAPSLHQAWKTLEQMRKGGIFDQIGYGFARYSTDERFLVPHFEKMLYDNALLILAYCAAFKASGEHCFLDTARQTADYVFREMTGKDGEFFSAQDADSEGQEGKYYVWKYDEICKVLGAEKGARYCRHFGITEQGNFEGQNIPNLLHQDIHAMAEEFEAERKQLYDHRKARAKLHTDDKILTAWNALMVCAMTALYRVSGQPLYLLAAQKAQAFMEKHLTSENILYVSCRGGKHSSAGFLDDYAYDTMGLLSLYGASGNPAYLERAQAICREAMGQFSDRQGGYFLYGTQNAPLITRPKESYDGALPSGNSVMAYCLVRLSQLTVDGTFGQAAEKQLAFLYKEAAHNPAGHCMFLIALICHSNPPEKITVILSGEDTAGQILPRLPLYADITILARETDSYRLLNHKATYYVCKGHTCLPPSNSLPE